jgi:hypothetical protein
MEDPMAGTPEAGWYADPADAKQVRYWDGNAWTTQIRSSGPSLAPETPRHRLPAIAITGIVVGALLAVGGITAILLNAGNDPVSGAQPAGDNEVQFTSDSGLITINVPASWKEDTAAAREYFDLVDVPGMTVQASWDLDAAPWFGGASATIATYDHVLGDSVEMAEQTFSALEGFFTDARTLNRGTYTTEGGIVLQRLDFQQEVSGVAMYQIELIAVVDGMGLEITATLLGDTLSDVDLVLEAVDTFVMR